MKRALSFTLIILAALMLFSCSEEKVFKSGEITDTAYESSELGIGFALGEGWSFATDEEMSEIFGIAEDVLGEDIKSSPEQLYEFYAYSDSGATVNLIVEKLGSESYVKSNLAAIMESTIGALEPELEKIYTEAELSSESFTIAGNEYLGYTCNASLEGLNAYHRGFCVPYGGYLASFSLFSLDKNELDSICDMFYSLSEK